MNGSIFQRGNQLHADYVFESNYKLGFIEQLHDWNNELEERFVRLEKTSLNSSSGMVSAFAMVLYIQDKYHVSDC
ncbi:MAG: hypothetical protein ACMUIU_20045 [bacterium]